MGRFWACRLESGPRVCSSHQLPGNASTELQGVKSESSHQGCMGRLWISRRAGGRQGRGQEEQEEGACRGAWDSEKRGQKVKTKDGERGKDGLINDNISGKNEAALGLRENKAKHKKGTVVPGRGLDCRRVATQSE